MAINAFRAGVADYYRWDISGDDLLKGIRKHLPADPRAPGPDASQTAIAERMIGGGRRMRQIKAAISKMAATESTVLISGETGTGKELVAETLHRLSPRSNRRLVSLNCAALPDSLVESELFGYRKGAFTGAVAARKGKFELASGGTLFLDEIGDMSLQAQAKILRTIENKVVYPLSAGRGVPLDVRLVAATNQDPETLMAEGRFRKDLYYRLNVARVHLPPLRERKEDIPRLVDLELAHLNRQFRGAVAAVAEEAMSSFFLYDWPGNIRELKNMLEAAYINSSGKRIRFTDLPEGFTKRLTFSSDGVASDRDRLLAALSATHWNKSKAAQKLNWSRMKVYRTLERYNIAGVPPAGH
jgi:transcriptional regulator with PAS, ATPase and Fis domain